MKQKVYLTWRAGIWYVEYHCLGMLQVFRFTYGSNAFEMLEKLCA